MKCLCLQALTIVYGKCYEEIGPFTDTKYIVGMLDRVSTSIVVRSNVVMTVEVFLYPLLYPEIQITLLLAVHGQTRKRQTHSLPQQTHSQHGKLLKSLNPHFNSHSRVIINL